jgi:beta-hydroxyacyl-ACP dehydratase FabZ
MDLAAEMDVLELLPHRYPFLLVDRVVEAESRQRIVAIKNVTHNEPFFPGHFPGDPVMPGVLIVEAMAQAAALLGFQDKKSRGESGLVVLMGLDKVRFRKPVRPGDELRLEVVVKRAGSKVWVAEGEARVGEALVASAQISASFVEKIPD